MSNPEHRAILAQGVAAWNRWRERYPSIEPNLEYIIWKGARADAINFRGVNLAGANLDGIDLRGADLRKANLQRANLKEANFEAADLRSANFYRTNLSTTNLKHAHLGGANLDEVDLSAADLRFANLDHTSMRFARLVDTNFAESDVNAINYYYTTQQATFPIETIEVAPGHLLLWLRCQDPECNEIVACLELIRKDISYDRVLDLWKWQGQEEETKAFLVIQYMPFARPYEVGWSYSMREGLPFWQVDDQEVEYVLSQSRWWLRNAGIPLSQADYQTVEQALRQGSFSKLYWYLAERNRWRSPFLSDPTSSQRRFNYHWEESVGFFCEACTNMYCYRHFDVERWDYGHGGEIGYIFSCRCGDGGPGEIP